MNKIKVAIVGVGNCASSLVQGRYFYEDREAPTGLIHERIGGYAIADIDFVCALTSSRKVAAISRAILPTQLHAVFQKDVRTPASPSRWPVMTASRAYGGQASAASAAPPRHSESAEIVAARRFAGRWALPSRRLQQATRFDMVRAGPGPVGTACRLHAAIRNGASLRDRAHSDHRRRQH